MRKVIALLLVLGIISGVWLVYQKGGEKRAVGDVIESNEQYTLSKVVFKGEDGKNVYALFFAPNKQAFDVVIVLPAAGGTKESRKWYGNLLGGAGYGSLIIDQRGVGETGGYVNSLQQDFASFQRKERVHQMLMATDVSNAADYLKKSGRVKNLAVLGESMGGRNAVIAAALDSRLKTAIIISSAGYSRNTGSPEGDQFLEFINPNSYISKISPRRLLMLHAVNDNVVLLKDARTTFSFAQEPKKFLEFSEKECIHGYCDPMKQDIEEELHSAFV